MSHKLRRTDTCTAHDSTPRYGLGALQIALAQAHPSAPRRAAPATRPATTTAPSWALPTLLLTKTEDLRHPTQTRLSRIYRLVAPHASRT